MKNKREILISVLLIWLPTVLYMYRTKFVLNSSLDKQLFWIPLLITVFSIFCILVSHELDRRNKIPKIVDSVICISLPLLFSLSQFKWSADSNEGREFILKSGNVLIGILIIIIGNYLPKMQFSRFVGLKFWWLKNRLDIWKKSHLLAGYTWIMAGIIMIISGKPDSVVYICIYFILLYLIPLTYAVGLFWFTEDSTKNK